MKVGSRKHHEWHGEKAPVAPPRGQAVLTSPTGTWRNVPRKGSDVAFLLLSGCTHKAQCSGQRKQNPLKLVFANMRSPMWDTFFDGLSVSSPSLLLTETLICQWLLLVSGCLFFASGCLLLAIMGPGMYTCPEPTSRRDLSPWWDSCRKRRPFAKALLASCLRLPGVRDNPSSSWGSHLWLEGGMSLTLWRWQRSKTEKARPSMISVSYGPSLDPS